MLKIYRKFPFLLQTTELSKGEIEGKTVDFPSSSQTSIKALFHLSSQISMKSSTCSISGTVVMDWSTPRKSEIWCDARGITPPLRSVLNTVPLRGPVRLSIFIPFWSDLLSQRLTFVINRWFWDLLWLIIDKWNHLYLRQSGYLPSNSDNYNRLETLRFYTHNVSKTIRDLCLNLNWSLYFIHYRRCILWGKI